MRSERNQFRGGSVAVGDGVTSALTLPVAVTEGVVVMVIWSASVVVLGLLPAGEKMISETVAVRVLLGAGVSGSFAKLFLIPSQAPTPAPASTITKPTMAMAQNNLRRTPHNLLILVGRSGSSVGLDGVVSSVSFEYRKLVCTGYTLFSVSVSTGMRPSS